MNEYRASQLIHEINEAETVEDLRYILKEIVRELVEDPGA